SSTTCSWSCADPLLTCGARRRPVSYPPAPLHRQPFARSRHIHIIYVTIITKLLPLSRLNVFVWLSLGLLVGF
ncbi:hypothetical protein, partial [Serratia marcescens]|uniref:hypothetical protein n=1 Tax=Serratia marcescens TaxID=615 RepID=UPI001F14F402